MCKTDYSVEGLRYREADHAEAVVADFLKEEHIMFQGVLITGMSHHAVY